MIEIDVNKVIKELLVEGTQWDPMIMFVSVVWHPAEPDVGIDQPIPEDVEHSLRVNGVPYGRGRWEPCVQVISHATGIEAHKIDVMIAAEIEDQISKLEYPD